MVENNKEIQAKPSIRKSTKELVILLDDLWDSFPHRYKYGWGNDIQHLVRELYQCFNASQIASDYNVRVKSLERYLILLDTINNLLDFMTAKAVLPINKMNMIIRKMDEIKGQVKGLRAYFANISRIS